MLVLPDGGTNDKIRGKGVVRMGRVRMMTLVWLGFADETS